MDAVYCLLVLCWLGSALASAFLAYEVCLNCYVAAVLGTIFGPVALIGYAIAYFALVGPYPRRN